MYKVQVVLVPPSVRDNFVPVGFTSTLEDSSQLMTNGATQANLPNGLENSIQNWNSTNNSMMLSSYFTQPRLKRFLMFTNPSNTLLDLADEILTKCEKMYPNVANDIEILSLQDSNSCDLDPDFVVKDVFNMDNTVRVILKDEINLDADVTQPVSLYGNAKRRKLNNGEQQQAPIIQQQVSTNQQQTQNTGTLKVAKKRNSNTTARSTTNPNLRISTPLANQIFPSQASNNSDDEDDIAERSFLPPPTHPQSPPIRISSGIETSKRIKYSTAEDTVSRSETVDPDKSRQQRMLSGTPLRTDMTPNRVTLTGQRVVSESYNGTPRSNGLIFTNTTTQPSTARRGSMNNARITSGMLTIPEPKIAEVEKELKEGPSSPASMLPPKADRIPMKKPYMEHPVVSGEESSSSSDTYDIPQNVEKSPSIRKQDSSHNETLEESPVKSSPFNTVSSQNNSERRRSSNLQSSFSKSSRDSQRLSSLEAKIENKSLSQRSIRRINNFSEDEIEDQQEELQVAKLPPRTKESKAPEVNETNDFPDNGDMDNVDQDTSMDIENEANNTVRYTDIKDELHNKSHEPVNKQDLLNILDKPQGIKSGKKLVDETENALLEKPTEQKESSAESVVETKLVATPPVQTKKRGAAETVKELMKTSEDVSTKKIKPSPTTNKKKESAGATQTKKQAETKRSPVKESSKNTSKSEEQNRKTVVPKKNVETSLSKEEEIKKTSIDPEKKGNVDLFEKFVSNTNVKRIKPAHEATQLKRTAQDESEYYSTSDDSDSDSEPVDSNRKERNIQINDIMSLQNTTSKKTTKPEAPKLSRKTATVTNTEKIASNNTSSSSEASSTNEENDSEAERKAILKPVTGTYPSPSIANRGTTETDALDNASTKAELETYRKARKVAKAKAVASNKTANKNQKVYQSPEFVSSSDDEDASTDTEKASPQTKVAPNPQDTAATKQGVKPEAIQKKEAASKLKIDSKEAINSKLAGKNKSEASAKVTNSLNEVSKTEAASQKINEDKKSAAATENAKAAKQTTDKAVKDTETKAVKKATKSPSKSVVEKPEPKSTNIAGKKAETAETKSSSNISKSSVISKSSEADNKAQVKNVKPANKKAAKEETEPIKKDNVKEEKQPAKKAEPKPKPPVTTISKANNSKETDIKVAKPKQNVKEEAAKKDMKKELTKPTSKPSSEQNSSESSTDSSTSSGSDASSSSDSDNGSSSSGSDSDSGSSSSDESSSDEESSSARVSRRMIVAPPKGVLSETKPSNIKDTTHKVEDVSAIDEVPQSTQQPSKTPSKAVKQPSMTRPPLKSASKDTAMPSSQPTEPTISNMSSQPPQLDNSKSSANTSKVDNASPLSNLPRKYRPSLSSLSDLVSRGIPAVKDKHDKSSAPSLAKRGKEIKKDGSLSESESESSSSSSESESDSSGDSGSGDSSSDSDSDSSSDSDSDSDSSSSEEETYISAKSANAALNKKKKKTNGGGGFASLIKDSKKHK